MAYTDDTQIGGEDTEDTAPEGESKPSGYAGVKASLNSLMNDIRSSDPGKPPSRDKIDDLMTRIDQNKVNLPPGVDLSPINAMQDKAYDMYDKRATRDEWLQFANTMGQALSRLGMAAAGARTNTDVSGVRLPEGPNFLQDQERAGGDLNRQLSLANQVRENAIRSNQYAQQQARQDWGEQNRSLQEQLGAERGLYGQEMGQYKQSQAQNARDLRQLQGESAKADLAEQLASSRQAASEARASALTTKQAAPLQAQAKAAGTLYDVLSKRAGDSELDYSDISKDRPLQDLAKRSGTTLEEAVNQFNSAQESSTTHGARSLAHPFTGPTQIDEAQRANLFKQGVLGDTIVKLNQLRGSTAPAAPAAPSSAPKAGDIISGYRFLGGDPSDRANWQKVGK